MSRRLPRWAVAALLTIPAFGAGLAISAAASGSSSTTYYACLHNGNLSKVSPHAHLCHSGFTVVSWNAVGQQGIQGPQGQHGVQGAQGPPGGVGAGCLFLPATGTADWHRCWLQNVDLSGDGTIGSGANLTGANLGGANLTGANLLDSTLTGANLTDANLTRTNLYDANLTGANLTGVTWNSTPCPDGTNSDNDGGTCINDLTPA